MIKDQVFLKSKASYCLDLAKKMGATDATVTVGHSISETVNFRNKFLEASDRSDENLAARGSLIYGNEYSTLSSELGSSAGDATIQVSASAGIGTFMFKYGSYIQVDEEIMRISSPSLTGTNQINVLRGVFATGINTHYSGSLVKAIKPVPIEFRRPSILRASGHTFEYLGYGPGNYSTALPQVQDRTLTEREEFLVQSQEKAGGIVVYTGMNNKGDFYIGNQKKSSTTGEETTYDTPIPTVTGEDPARLSAVFDEVTIKERIVVEGGDSGEILSQFDGPVTFSKSIKSNSDVTVAGKLKITEDTNATSTTSGSLQVAGGVGVGKSMWVAGIITASSYYGDGSNLENITTTTINNNADNRVITGSGTANELNGETNLTFDGTNLDMLNDKKIRLGDSQHLSIYHSTDNDSYIKDTGTGNLKIQIDDGADILIQDIDGKNSAVFDTDAGVKLHWRGSTGAGTKFETTETGATVTGALLVTDDITAFYSTSDKNLKDNISPIKKALDKVNSISGNTFTWKEGNSNQGEDTGVVAQEIETLGLPGIVKDQESGHKSVQYHKLVPLLIEAVKELSAKVDKLEQHTSDK